VSGTPLPAVFRKYARVPADTYTMTPAEIGANRNQWLDQWTQIVLQ
jgi:ABC-type thiamine transport system substrate-binding protein